jgi:hypothetical protein
MSSTHVHVAGSKMVRGMPKYRRDTGGVIARAGPQMLAGPGEFCRFLPG